MAHLQQQRLICTLLQAGAMVGCPRSRRLTFGSLHGIHQGTVVQLVSKGVVDVVGADFGESIIAVRDADFPFESVQLHGRRQRALWAARGRASLGR